jgi:hypothetical protein
MKDLALDRTNHDLIYDGADLLMVDELDQIEQSLKERLLFYRQEWFLDTTSGIPFYDEVLVKNPNIPNIENIIKAEIMDTPGAIELLSFQSEFDAQARSYSVTFSLRTEFGIASLDLSIF